MKVFGLALLYIGSVFSIGCSKGQLRSEILQNVNLKAYAHCVFSDELEIIAVDPLAPSVTARTVDTAGGPKLIKMLSGIRIMFAYPNTDFFANVKVEQLPGLEYIQLKQALIENFDYILASSSSNKPNYTVTSRLNLLDSRGLDRDRLEGGVIGVYLLFDDEKCVATTVYFLNQDPSQRKFQNMDEYRTLRDRFLSTYTSCIRNSL